MKKKIILLTTFLISFIIFTDNVEADKYMYLECEYSKEDIDSLYGLYRNFSDYTIFVPLTDNEGNVTINAIRLKKTFSGTEWMKLKTDCWLKKAEEFSDDCDDDDINLIQNGSVKINDILNNGTCPAMLTGGGFGTYKVEAVGISNTNKIPKDKQADYIISEPTFAFYEIDGKKIAEGYSTNGKYSYVGPDIVRATYDEVEYYQMCKIFDLKEDYWKVYDYESQMVTVDMQKGSIDGVNVCEGITKKKCENKHGYKLYYDSIDSNKNIENGIIAWYNKEKKTIGSLSEAAKIKDNNKLLEECKNINSDSESNNTEYKFNNYNSASSFISDIESVYDAMRSYYGQSQPKDYCTENTTEPISSVISYLYDAADFCEIDDLKFEEDNEHGINEKNLLKNFEEKVKEVAKNSNNEEIAFAFNSSETIKEYFDEVYRAISFMSAFPDKFNLSSEETNKLNILKDNMKNLGEGKGLNTNIVFTCDDLFGEDLINKIKSYLKIIKIAIPILLLAFGILDFFKATFASDEEAMTKAKKTFIKRLGIAVLIFLVPTFVDLLLKLANNVWSTITPNSCNIYK